MCVCERLYMATAVHLFFFFLQGAQALSGGLLPTKTPPGRGENVPAVVHLGRWTPAGGHQKICLCRVWSGLSSFASLRVEPK